MQRHVKVYLDYFDLKEGDPIFCEVGQEEGRVGGAGFDIHHIDGRGKDKDVITNLMCLCRKHHDQANTNQLPRKELHFIHNCFLAGQRKKFYK
jgi:hypothetical protein